MKCCVCDVPLVGRVRWKKERPAGHKRHVGRGLCPTCRQRAERHGTIADFERSTRSLEETLEEMEHLIDAGCPTLDLMAERLGSNTESLKVVVRRGVQRDHELALKIRRMLDAHMLTVR